MWRIVAIGALAPAGACRCGDGDGGKDGGDGGDDDDDAPVVVVNVRVDGAEAATSDPDSAEVRMCTTADGAVVVAWSDDRDGVPAVWARRSPDGGVTWADPPARFGDPAAVAEHPALACVGSGAVLAWEDQRAGDLSRSTVYASGSADGGATWSPQVPVMGDGTFQELAPSVAAAGPDVVVAWYGDLNGAYDVFSARTPDLGASWEAPIRVDSDAPGSAWSAHPVVGGREDGSAWVAWEDRRAGVADVYVSGTDAAGVAFTPDARVDDGDGDSYGPVVLASGADAVDVAWHDRRDGEAYEVYLAHSADSGASFEAPVRISAGEPPGTVDAVLPRLAADADGVVHVVFYGGSGGGYHVQHRVIAAGVPGAGPTIVDHAPPTALARDPALAVDGTTVAVAWQDTRDAADEGQGDLYYAFSEDGGATFGTADQRIDTRPAGGPLVEDLAVDLVDGVLLAAWTDARDGTADVWFARVPLGTSAVAP